MRTRRTEKREPCVVVHTPEPSDGAALYVSELVKALAGGVRVALFCPRNFDYASEVRAAGARIIACPVRTVSPAGLPIRLWRNIKFAAQTAALQFRAVNRGDVVHFQFPIHLPLGFLFFLLVPLKRARIVLTAHDPLPHKWRFPAGLRSLERAMLGAAYRLCDGIVVHNEAGRNTLVREFGCDDNRIFTIPHGPLSPRGLNLSNPPVQRPPEDCLRLLCFGAIRENKGIHLAIQAVQKLNSESGLHVHLTIAGRVDGSDHAKYWESCKSLISQDPRPFEVMERFIRDGEIASLLEDNHAALLPYSDFVSESGVAALALSHARPIIATAAGGLTQLLTESGGGIHIETATVDSVAKAIRIAIKLGRERLLSMGRDGCRYISSQRSWQSIAIKTTEMYRKLGCLQSSSDKVPQLSDGSLGHSRVFDCDLR